MSMSDLIAIALNQTISWAKRTGIDHYGMPSYEQPKDIACRVSYQSRLVINKDGDEVTSSAQVTTLEPVGIGDKLTLNGRAYIVISVKEPQTFAGAEHRRKAYV